MSLLLPLEENISIQDVIAGVVSEGSGSVPFRKMPSLCRVGFLPFYKYHLFMKFQIITLEIHSILLLSFLVLLLFFFEDHYSIIDRVGNSWNLLRWLNISKMALVNKDRFDPADTSFVHIFCKITL